MKLIILAAFLLLFSGYRNNTSSEVTEYSVSQIAGSGSSVLQTTDSVSYSVHCVDEEGNPVSGAYVQFCDDTMCRMEETDEKGLVYFEAEKGEYQVHLLVPPEGYAEDDTEYATSDEGETIEIVLKKAE